MTITERTVWATVDLEGWHRWPDAPPHRDYLADRHRHLFKIAATVPVDDDHRQVEFHDLRDTVVAAWQPEWDAASCERIAQHIAATILTAHQVPSCQVTVSEDGECGATVTVR